MDPHISLVTLGVDDLKAAVRFYRDGLGLPKYELESDEVAFFELSGTWLGLFPRTALADDVGVSVEGSGFPGFSLAHNVDSKADVDAVLDEAEAAGATIVKPAQEADWGGYAGYFADPDGFLWEVAWNPFISFST